MEKLLGGQKKANTIIYSVNVSRLQQNYSTILYQIFTNLISNISSFYIYPVFFFFFCVMQLYIKYGVIRLIKFKMCKLNQFKNGRSVRIAPILSLFLQPTPRAKAACAVRARVRARVCVSCRQRLNRKRVCACVCTALGASIFVECLQNTEVVAD